MQKGFVTMFAAQGGSLIGGLKILGSGIGPKTTRRPPQVCEDMRDRPRQGANAERPRAHQDNFIYLFMYIFIYLNLNFSKIKYCLAKFYLFLAWGAHQSDRRETKQTPTNNTEKNRNEHTENTERAE